MPDTDSAPTGDANQQDGGQANSPVGSDAEVISALTNQLKNLEAQVNSMRSEKDKGVSQTNKRLSEFEKKQEELLTMQKYVEKYGSAEDAARAMAIDAFISQSGQEPQVPAQTQSPDEALAGQQQVQDADKNLVPLLLGPDGEKDPAYVQLVRSGLKPNDAAIRLAEQRKAAQQQHDPNAASGIVGSGSGGAGETQQTALEHEYRERLGKIKQGDWKSIGNLKDEMRKKGYEIW